MNKEKMAIIFLIILGLVITLFLGGQYFKEGFTSSNIIKFKELPMDNPKTPTAKLTFINNDVNSLVFNLNNKNTKYTLTNTSNIKPITYNYNGDDSTNAKLIIPIPKSHGLYANIKQLFIVTDITGKITRYGTYESFIKPQDNKISESKQNDNKNNNKKSNFNSYDNYNHYNKTSSISTNEKTFYGPNGGIATLMTNSDGTQVLKVTLSTNDKPLIFTPSRFSISGETFYGPNGGTATLVDNNGKKAIIVKNDSGVYIYKLEDYNKYNSQYDMTSTQYFGSTGYTIYPFQPNAYTQQNKNQSSQNIPSSSLQSLTPSSSPSLPSLPSYNSALPQGIPGSQIPKGQEDLYILKSEVVPPVCPACPTTASCPRQEPCQPCPPCARCPEPSFECKKVPNYNAINNQYLPAPIVNSFSSFSR